MNKFKSGGFSNNSSIKFDGLNYFSDEIKKAVKEIAEEMKNRYGDSRKHHFCQPGINVDKHPEVIRTSEFDNSFGNHRQKIKEGVYLLNQPTGDLYLCFDVTDAVIVE